MPRGTTRAHVVLPEEVVRSIDALVGRRGRSKFVAEAAAEKLARLRLARAAKRAASSLAEVPVPGWESSASAAEWVRASRRDDEARRSRAAEDRSS